MSSVTHAAEVINGQRDEVQPKSASDDFEVLSADYSTALQELMALPKSKVSSMVSLMWIAAVSIVASAQRLSGCPVDSTPGACAQHPRLSVCFAPMHQTS